MRAYQAAAAALFVTVTGLVLSSCSAPPPEPEPRTVRFTAVDDEHQSDYYDVGAAVDGVTDEFGTRLVIPIMVTRANRTSFNPAADVSFPDGTTVHCEEEDVRRWPSLVESTDSVEVPCESDFPKSTAGAVVTVTDLYDD